MSSERYRYADVALSLPGTEPLTYCLSPDQAEIAAPGLRAEVPVGGRRMVGVITGLRDRTHHRCRPVSDILDSIPVLDDHLMWLTSWVAQRYLCSWGQAIWAALPPGMNRRQTLAVELAPAAAGLSVAGAEARILDLLKGRGRVAAGWLLGTVGEGGREALSRLEKAGAVVIAAEWRGGVGRARCVRYLVRKQNGQVPKLTPARSRLWDELIRSGEIPSARLSSASAAAWLVKAGLASWERRELPRLPAAAPASEPEVLRLNAEQRDAWERIAGRMERGGHEVRLLFGVTASGKTELYIRAARMALERGRQALILVPEIGLISQMASRLARYFPALGIWHSELSAGERYDVWRACRQGSLPLVVGVRSAAFAPLEKLGIVVVDEEHDASYKQHDAEPYYHARQVVIARAERLGIQVLLGSATPSAESYHQAREGAYSLSMLGRRATGSEPPRVELVDCRAMSDRGRTLADGLAVALRDTVAAGGQAMLLLNRRGFARAVQCLRCGAFVRCRNCDISLTYHRGLDQAVCHYCGYRRTLPEACPACGSDGLQARGGGVQRLEQELGELLPGTGLLRMDSDTTARKGSHHRILSAFLKGEARVLIGTQMIAKGHHFPGVTLVGLLDIDGMMGLPDFRSSERAAQLLVQMSGRAGRGDQPGRVMVQTRQPGAAALTVLGVDRYREMLEAELEQRRQAGYPPYKNIALVTVAAGDCGEASGRAEEIVRRLRLAHPGVEVLGPAPALIPRLRGRFRQQVLLKHADLGALLAAGRSVGRGSGRVSVRVDIDPSSTL